MVGIGASREGINHPEWLAIAGNIPEGEVASGLMSDLLGLSIVLTPLRWVAEGGARLLRTPAGRIVGGLFIAGLAYLGIRDKASHALAASSGVDLGHFDAGGVDAHVWQMSINEPGVCGPVPHTSSLISWLPDETEASIVQLFGSPQVDADVDEWRACVAREAQTQPEPVVFPPTPQIETTMTATPERVVGTSLEITVLGEEQQAVDNEEFMGERVVWGDEGTGIQNAVGAESPWTPIGTLEVKNSSGEVEGRMMMVTGLNGAVEYAVEMSDGSWSVLSSLSDVPSALYPGDPAMYLAYGFWGGNGFTKLFNPTLMFETDAQGMVSGVTWFCGTGPRDNCRILGSRVEGKAGFANFLPAFREFDATVKGYMKDKGDWRYTYAEDGTLTVVSLDGKRIFGDVNGEGQFVPATPEVGASAVLAELGYSATDHESFVPANYRIETREWEGAQTPMLIHTDPATKEERIDGMEVTINGEKEWVRGIWYETTNYPGSGGVVVDMLGSLSGSKRAYLTEGVDPNDLYGELLRAVANQRGIPYENVWKYIQSHGYKVSIRLPENAKPGSKQSPSTLKLSPLTEVDFSKPFVRAFRGSPYAGQEFDGADVPEKALYLLGDYRVRDLWFEVNGQLYSVVIDYQDGASVTRGGHQAFTLFHDLELLARMEEGFVDGDGEDNQLITKTGKLMGKEYKFGSTVINRDVLFQFTLDFKDYLFSIFELR